jgi:flagellar assembly protein FliH
VGVAIIHRLLPNAVARYGLAEIEALIEGSVKVLADEPRLIIRLMKQQGDHVKTRIDPVLKRHGFEGRVLVLVDDTLGPSDIKLEWTDGGAERLMSMTWASVDAAMRRVRGDQASLGDPPPVDDDATEPGPRPQHMAESGERAPNPPPPEPEPKPEPWLAPETEMDVGGAVPEPDSKTEPLSEAEAAKAGRAASMPPPDAMPPDAMPPDAMPPDAIPPDAISPDAMPTDAMPTEEEAITA